jgi:hypothetical protein
MPAVLTLSSKVLCGLAVLTPVPLHGGTVKIVGATKLTVSRSPVLLESGINGQKVIGCTTVTNTSTGNKQCSVVTAVDRTSLAKKLRVGGNSVVLASLTGATDGSPGTTLNATANQVKLTTI